MKLIIDIPDEYFEQIKNNTEGPTAESEAVYAIRNGISYEERPQVTVFAENASKEEIEDFKKELEAVLKRPEGEWVGNAFDEHHCNRCGHPALWEEEPDGYYEVQSRFCPNCGARMQEGDAE